MFIPDLLLAAHHDALTQHGHACLPFRSSNKLHYTHCTQCGTLYYIARYSGVACAALRHIVQCTPVPQTTPVYDTLDLTDTNYALSRYTDANTTIAPCAYCGGTTTVDRRCKYCYQVLPRAMNISHRNDLPQYITYNYEHYKLLQVEHSPDKHKQLYKETFVCLLGEETQSRGIYIPRDPTATNGLETPIDSFVPVVRYTCTHTCTHYASTLLHASWYTPRMR